MPRATRKNSSRLKQLRGLGIPIGGDYRLTAKWANLPSGAYLAIPEQKLLLSSLQRVS